MAEQPHAEALESAAQDLAKVAPIPRKYEHLSRNQRAATMTPMKRRLMINKSAGMTKPRNRSPQPRKITPFSLTVGKQICDKLSESLDSLIGLLRDNPQFPSYGTIQWWKETKPKFAAMLSAAREKQAEYIAQTCLDLAKTATKDNAHAVRIKFDIARWYASKLLPAVYGDKPQDVKVSTTVQLAISPQRLEDIRGRLEATRSLMIKDPLKKEKSPLTLTNGQNRT